MKKSKAFLLGVFLLFSIVSFGQREISGIVVSSSKNEPIYGVSIKIKGTLVGTLTDEYGKYSISVPEGKDTLFFSHIEFESVVKKIGVSNSLDVVMKPITALETVVVTALGVKRSEKALGYAISTIDSETIRNSNQTNLVNSLSGVVAGANVTQSTGAAGGSSSVTLRGFTSITGNNQALFVIDGVKVNNNETTLGGEDAGNTESVGLSNRGIDINPDDVESITVLKGGAASAIYGIDGANGVILITTKKGKKATADGKNKFSVSAGSQITASQVNKLPKLQNKYAQGSYDDTEGKPIYLGPADQASTSWGPQISELSYDGATDNPYDKNGNVVLNSDPTAKTAMKAYDNLGDFFKTGITTKNNFSISGGSENASVRLSVSNLKENGVIPTNTFEKNNISLGSNLTFFDKRLNVTGTANYINSGGVRIQQGSNLSGIMLGLLRTSPSFDNSNGYSKPWDNVDAYQLPNGKQRNYRGGAGYDNPFWSVNKNPFIDDVNRFLGNFQFSFKFSKWATLGANLGLDTYSDKRQQVFAIGSRANPLGKITNELITVKQSDHYYTLSGGSTLTKDKKLDFSYNIGLNTFQYYSTQLYSIGKAFAFDNFGNLGAATNINSSNIQANYKSFSMFGSFDFGYNSMFYLTITTRQDYDSRFMVPNREVEMKNIGFFYPSVSGTFIFSELIKNKKILDFGKLRMSWAQVAKGPTTAYSTGTVYEQLSGTENIADGWTPSGGIAFPYQGVTSYGLSNTQGNPTLKPERTNEFEVGTNLGFFGKRIVVDFAYYQRQTKNAIVPVSVSGTTGYEYIYMNTGQIHTNGIDLMINGTAIKKVNFEWNIATTFTKYKSIVDKLADGLDQLFVGGFTGTAIYHIPGEQYGQLYGGDFARTSDGKIVIDDDVTSSNYGYPLADPKLKVIGNPNPKFIMGITNRFRFKNFEASFLIDMKVGGQMWNGTQGALTYFGMSQNTENRDAVGVTSTTFDGVLGHYDANGNLITDGTPNTTKVGLDQYWYQGNGGGFGNVASNFIQNASTYRLRNITLSYTFPSRTIKNVTLSEVRLFLTGNNLLLFTPYQGVDPETSLVGSESNAKGLDYFNMPNTRSLTFGVNIKL